MQAPLPEKNARFSPMGLVSMYLRLKMARVDLERSEFSVAFSNSPQYCLVHL